MRQTVFEKGDAAQACLPCHVPAPSCVGQVPSLSRPGKFLGQEPINLLFGARVTLIVRGVYAAWRKTVCCKPFCTNVLADSTFPEKKCICLVCIVLASASPALRRGCLFVADFCSLFSAGRLQQPAFYGLLWLWFLIARYCWRPSRTWKPIGSFGFCGGAIKLCTAAINSRSVSS